MNEPHISWEEDFDRGFYCRLRVPRSWLMESSQVKRKWLLWWWLTKLAWSMPQ